jgi:hypothetical protein
LNERGNLRADCVTSEFAVVSLLMWYESQPLSVALGWGVFGIVLFEYGLLRNTRQFRFQAYVALAAAFGRIFFANLTAGNPVEFWGPRIYTVHGFCPFHRTVCFRPLALQ